MFSIRHRLGAPLFPLTFAARKTKTPSFKGVHERYYNAKAISLSSSADSPFSLVALLSISISNMINALHSISVYVLGSEHVCDSVPRKKNSAQENYCTAFMIIEEIGTKNSMRTI